MKYFLNCSLIALVLLFVMAGLVRYTETPVHATLGTGAYTTVPYDSTNFGATAGMTFAVGTQNTYRYNVDENKQLHLMVDVLNSSTSGSAASSFITVKIPEGRTAGRTVTSAALMATDNGNAGVWETCYVIASQGSNSLLIRRASGANWPIISNTLRIDLNLTLEVNDAP
jgi:hypothetical protein